MSLDKRDLEKVHVALHLLTNEGRQTDRRMPAHVHAAGPFGLGRLCACQAVGAVERTATGGVVRIFNSPSSRSRIADPRLCLRRDSHARLRLLTRTGRR